MSRIFHPCILVPHFDVPQFHVLHFQRPRLVYKTIDLLSRNFLSLGKFPEGMPLFLELGLDKLLYTTTRAR